MVLIASPFLRTLGTVEDSLVAVEESNAKVKIRESLAQRFPALVEAFDELSCYIVVVPSFGVAD